MYLIPIRIWREPMFSLRCIPRVVFMIEKENYFFFFLRDLNDKKFINIEIKDVQKRAQGGARIWVG